MLDPALADVVAQAMAITLEQYFDAVRERGVLGSQMRVFMESYDLLLTPTLPIAAFGAGLLSPADEGKSKWVYWTPFSYPFNLTQQPAASVPCGFTKAGLPIGLQLIGNNFSEARLFSAGHAYEQNAGHWAQRPGGWVWVDGHWRPR